MFKRSKIVFWSVVAVAFMGCGPNSDSGSASDDIVQLTYWSSQNPQERLLATRLVDAWNLSHPNIQVTVQPLPAGQSSEEVLLAAVAAGTTPDLCSNIWPGVVSAFIKAGGVLALDSFADFDSLLQSRVPPTLHDRFKAEDGHFYQLPWKSNPILMQYNVRLFEEAGFATPPRTYSEFLTAAERISKDLNGDGRFDRWIGYRNIQPIWHERFFDYYSFYLGGTHGSPLFENGEVAIDTLTSNAVFEFFGELYRRNFFPKTKFQGNAFVSEQIATEFVGPWNIAWLQENAPPDLEYAYAPLPVPDGLQGDVHTYGDYKNITIFSNTKYPKETWAFAKYLVSKDADLLLLELATQIPIRRNLTHDSLFTAFFLENPKLIPFADQVPLTTGVEGVPGFAELLDAIAQQFEAASVYGIRSPSEATRRAIARIRVIQEWNK